MKISKFIEELRRRNVFRVATAYAIAGWLIIQIATSVFPAFNFPDWTQQFVIIITMIGFPLSIIFAWAFELTPEGLKKSKEVEITESVTNRTGKKLNGIIIAVLSVAVFFLLIERIFFAESSILDRNSADYEVASIAVLPFVNMSDDESNEYFSDGLSEELLNGLTKLENIQVAGRTSSFQFKGSNPDLRDVGDQLGVAHILEGSVRKSGNRVRITAQLIQADNGFHLWSETYDRELTATDIFDIQEEITRKVVAELKIQLLPQEEEEINNFPTTDFEAYNAFLEATQLEVSQTEDDLLAAVEKYKRAIQIDPSFALAYARLALVYGDLNWNGNLSLDDMKKLMRENIDQALLIDGNEGKAYEALGYYYLNIEDNQKALETYERAMELLPGDAEVLVGYHDVLHEFSLHEESHVVLMQAYEIDPLNPEIGTELASHLIYIEETERGLALYEEILKNNPNYTEAKVRISQAYAGIGSGELGKAFINVYEVYKEDPENVDIIASLSGLSESLGMYLVQEHFIQKMGELYPNNQLYYFMYANYYSEHGKIDEILEFVDTQRGIFSDEFNKEIDTFIARLTFLKGEEEKAINMYEDINPIVLSESVIISSNDEKTDINTYLYYLKHTGQYNSYRYQYLNEVFCEYAKKTAEEAEFEAGKKYLKWDIGLCEFYKGNTEAYLEMLREQYFDFRLVSNFPGYFRFSRNPNSLSGNPEYEQLKSEILDDISVMREEVITYLKAQGEWKEEWGMD